VHPGGAPFEPNRHVGFLKPHAAFRQYRAASLCDTAMP
jgi:hypothetical protein